MKAVMAASVTVLERQYKKYFGLDLTERLAEETQSSRSHNMDAEEVMGMFSALQKKSPHATISFLSSKMRAQKNKTVEYIDSLAEYKQKQIIKHAITIARKKTIQQWKNKKELQKEIIARQKQKQHQRDEAERRKLERKLRTVDATSAAVAAEFPDLDEEKNEKLCLLLSGNAIASVPCVD